MTELTNDELLSAKLDDELNTENNSHAERVLQERPELQVRLESFDRVDDLLQQSFAQINETPLPRIDTETLAPRISPWTRSVSLPLSAAASVIMLLSGALIGIMAERLTAPELQTIAQPAATPDFDTFVPAVELSNTLETLASGTAATVKRAGSSSETFINTVRTWKLEYGRYCREYEITVDSVTPHEIGVACRESAGDWRIRLRTYPDLRGTFL